MHLQTNEKKNIYLYMKDVQIPNGLVLRPKYFSALKVRRSHAFESNLICSYRFCSETYPVDMNQSLL